MSIPVSRDRPTALFNLGVVSEHHRRRLFFLAADAVLLVLALLTAVLLRFEGSMPQHVAAQLPLLVLLSLFLKFPFLLAERLYAISWSRFSLGDLLATLRGLVRGSLLLSAVVLLLRLTPLLAGSSRAVLLLDFVLSVVAVGGFRISRRAYLYLQHNGNGGGRAAVIVGAGDAGAQLAQALLLEDGSPYHPYAFIDDNPADQGTLVHGIPVVGGRHKLNETLKAYHAEALLIAMPSAPPAVVRDVVARARQSGLRDIRIIPSLHRILNGDLALSDLRELSLEDLLGREVVRADTRAIGRMLAGKTALVTGAAGSIGSELCRQLTGFGVAALVLVDVDESGLFSLEQDLKAHRDLRADLRLTVADVRDPVKMRRVLAATHPNVVFHSAAYKHVPVMEACPEEALKANVLGTWIPALLSREFGVERFILISTDKAVRPTSVMGATKRVAEKVVATLNLGGPTRFISVRFGNVLGSRGSVVPLWQEQIRRGGPVTVTDPEMRRYFMVTSEAVLLVLQASAMGEGGEVFVLDMGQPIRILDLAHEVIRLSGFEPEADIPVVFTGARPGEKLTEEIMAAEDVPAATSHQKLFVARTETFASSGELEREIQPLTALAETGRPEDIVRVLRRLVPTYKPNGQSAV